MGVSAALLIAANGPLPLRAMQWLKADGTIDGMVAAVNYRPGLCLSDSASKSARMGEVLFRSPSLFGGQAAKARLTCQSCHVDGGDNPFFHFPSISGEAGTADVSNSFFSAAGSNATFDPIVIPSLADTNLGAEAKVSRTEPMVLEGFLTELIMKEFSGEKPSDTIVASLAAYTREIGACTKGAGQPRSSLEELIAQTENAVLFAKQRNDAGDHETATALLAAARDGYGLMHERFAGKVHDKLRGNISETSAALGPLQLSSDTAEWQQRHRTWRAQSGSLHQSLRQAESQSYFNDERLRSALQ